MILPSIVCTSVTHPTAQYGQTLGVTLAFLIRSSWARGATSLIPTLEQKHRRHLRFK
jgi:hypothetical protein